VIPMKNQYEQHCNAAALKELGVPVIKSLKAKHLPALKEWVESKDIVIIDYPDSTEEIIQNILQTHYHESTGEENTYTDSTQEDITVKQLRSLTLKKILLKLAN
jgi:hypothetical protein